MRFIIDAQLPESICECFVNCNCLHTKHLKRGNRTRDSLINELSFREKRAVITKDSDFYYSYLASQRPWKLVLVKLGNMRLQNLMNYFETNAGNITTLLENHSFIIIEPKKIRIME